MKYPKVIGISAWQAFIPDRTGTENYAYQIIHALVRQACDYRFRLYVKPDSALPSWTNAENVDVKVINWNRFWTQGGLAVELWRAPVDLLFVPSHVLPIFGNHRIPSVVTVHDLRSEFLPQHNNLLQKFYLNRYTERLRAFLASHIIAVSESTKRDVVKLLGVNESKVSVIYEGVEVSRFSVGRENDQVKISDVINKYGIDSGYVLFVGTVQPRKNLARLMEAMRLLVTDSKYSDLKLVIAGKRGWLADEIYETPAKLGISERVKFINYVEDADLPCLYAGAELFAFPSLYEGFGLPVLEALAAGTSVMTSNISSLPEVGGEFVEYIDPYDVGSIHRGLVRALSSKPEWNKVMAHLERFSWDFAGQATLRVFETML